MRLWSIHSGYLDSKGLVALWREGLLAQKVLLGNTKGYRNHPQLVRFNNANNSIGAIASYLRFVADEADSRNYNFDRGKIVNRRTNKTLFVTTGQVEYEFKHLLSKLKTRAPTLYNEFNHTSNIKVHPIFSTTKGPIEEWEIVR